MEAGRGLKGQLTFSFHSHKKLANAKESKCHRGYLWPVFVRHLKWAKSNCSFPFSGLHCAGICAFREAVKRKVPWRMTIYYRSNPALNHHFREWLVRNSSLMKSQGAITIAQFKAAQGTLRHCVWHCSLLCAKYTTTTLMIKIANCTIVSWNCISGDHRNPSNKLTTMLSRQDKLLCFSCATVLLELNGPYTVYVQPQIRVLRGLGSSN